MEVARAGAVRGERSASPRPTSLARSELGFGSADGGPLDAVAGSIRVARISRWIGWHSDQTPWLVCCVVAAVENRCDRVSLLRLVHVCQRGE